MRGYAADSALLGPEEVPSGSVLLQHRFLLCSILMATASALASLVFTCATPFAGLAAFAAAALPLPSALVAVSGTWLLDQVIGYGLLAYPISADSVAWGAALGVASLAATAVAAWLLGLRSLRGSLLRYACGLAAAFGVYELCLVTSGVLLGSLEAFTPPIVTRIAVLNIVAFMALALLWQLGTRLAAGLKGPRKVLARAKLQA
jgi:hypothetical protein